MVSVEAFSPAERFSPPQRPDEVQIILTPGENSHLEGTGFSLPLELRRLYKNYNQNISLGKSSEEAWALSVGEVEVNIRTFIVEYVQTKTVLPHVNRIEEVGGVNRMVGSNGVPVVEGITEQERQGGVKQASVKADQFISARIPHRVAVINSPLGHSGLFKNDGAEITYKDNQTMVFWIDQQGELHGLTLVTDLDEKQSKQLSVSLGVSEDLLTGQTQLEKVSNIVRNPALFSYAQALKNPAEYVLEKIISIRGSSDFRLVQEDGEVEIRSVAEIRADIKRMAQLLNFSQGIENRINRLKTSLLSKLNNLNNPLIQSEIERTIEETILNITIDYLKQNPNYLRYGNTSSISNSRYQEKQWSNSPDGQYLMAAAFLRSRAGCVGGSSSVRSLRGSSLGLGESFGLEGKGGKCDKCSRVADGHYHCPSCNAYFEDESDRAPGNYTPSCGCGYVFGCGTSAEAEKSGEEETQELAKAA